MSVKGYIVKCHQPLVMAFGNPLLDTIVINKNDSLNTLMQRFELSINGAVELEQEKLQDIFDNLPKDLKRTTVAGGSALNSMRFLQKLLGTVNQKALCLYFGAIGNDERGKRLKELVEDDNVDARFGVINQCPTGTTLAIVTNDNRSFAAHLGAAGKYSKAMLKLITLPFDKIKVLYIEGFFLVHSSNVAIEMAKMAEDCKILTAFNLSAEYIIEQNDRKVLDLLSYADIVFGNANEYEALAKLFPISYENVNEIPYHLNTLTEVVPDAERKKGTTWITKNTCFVMTQGGCSPPICVYGRNEAVSCNVTNVKVMDTTGAGDGLVAGFIAGVLSGQTPQTCLDWGCKVAEEVIQQLGATLPNDLPSNFLKMETGGNGPAIFR